MIHIGSGNPRAMGWDRPAFYSLEDSLPDRAAPVARVSAK